MDPTLPYQQVAAEILHWTYGSDRPAYELMIDEQCQAAQFVVKWRKKRSFSPTDIPSVVNRVELKAMCSLINANELTVDVSTQEKASKWNQLCEEHGIVPPPVIGNSKKRPRSPQGERSSYEDDMLSWSATSKSLRSPFTLCLSSRLHGFRVS